MIKKCIICGNEFTTNRDAQLCCSKKCSLIRNNEVAKENYKLHEASRKVQKKMPPSNHDAIADIAIEARKQGLTYGQYVAKMGLK